MTTIPETEGRAAFGSNALGYDKSRPEYPTWMFDILLREKALHRDATTLEVGPGNGLATRRLIEFGASPITLVEPDTRFAGLLSDLSDYADKGCEIIYKPFEEAELPKSSFDLIVIATAFHWLDPQTRVKRLAELTKRGGFVVLIWNVFQDLNLPDPFHEATKSILAGLSNSPSGKPDGLPFALDRTAREAEFLSTKCFAVSAFAESHWKLSLTPSGVRSLYEGFSNISRLPETEREALLDRVESVAKSEFSGIVERNMTSPLYIFRRN